jgi:hypothetical protein
MFKWMRRQRWQKRSRTARLLGVVPNDILGFSGEPSGGDEALAQKVCAFRSHPGR